MMPEVPALVKYQMVNGMVLNPSASSSTAMESNVKKWKGEHDKTDLLALICRNIL